MNYFARKELLYKVLTMKFSLYALTMVIVTSIISCGQNNQPEDQSMTATTTSKNEQGLEKATFGSGCFWCTEAIFLNVDGVTKVESGYEGGRVKNPTYKEVCSGLTGHAEVIQLQYDPNVVSYEELLEIFWQTHDPTTLNRQGADVGTQYRSVVFYHNEEQRQIAEESKKRLEQSGKFKQPIAVKILPAKTFYPAEEYHQYYYKKNPLHYERYHIGSGRAAFIKQHWGDVHE